MSNQENSNSLPEAAPDMPTHLVAYLRSLNPGGQQEIWDWADGNPEAITQIINVVAKEISDEQT